MLSMTEDIVPNWLLATPDPNVSVGKICKPFKVEMVIRGYLTGHAADSINLAIEKSVVLIFLME